MKFYRPLFFALIEGLQSVLVEKKIASKVLEIIFKNNKKWGSKDRKAFAESFYEIVKWYLLIKKVIEKKFDFDWDLIVVFYLTQKGFILEVVSDSERQRKYQEVINYSKSINLKDLSLDLPLDSDFADLKIFDRFSFPENLHQIVIKELEDVLSFYKASQLEAPLFVRANTHLTTVVDLQNKFKEEGFETYAKSTLPYGLLFQNKINIFRSEAFKQGLFEVQDGGSQLISEFLQVESGQLIIDACAGGGGKTLHLSNLSLNKGRIISMDVHQWKLDELKKRARRNQCHNIESRLIESTKVIKRLKDKADRLLLDVPCTGSGVFRRNPDAKYKWSAEQFNEILELQAKILNEYSVMVKPKGKMVYSTCSAFKSENQVQIQKFLNQNENWTLEEEKFIPVGQNQFDGYYMARLQRNQ